MRCNPSQALSPRPFLQRGSSPRQHDRSADVPPEVGGCSWLEIFGLTDLDTRLGWLGTEAAKQVFRHREYKELFLGTDLVERMLQT